MSSLVLELEHEAYDSSASLSNMLRKTKAIAVKLQLKQPMEWVEAELGGYTSGKVPEYRVVHGRVKAHNPFHGLIPVVIGHRELERVISEHRVTESVGAIEHMLETKGELMVPFSGEKAAKLAEMCGSPTFPVYLMLSRSSFVSILDTVRDKVLDWSLKLQTDGITGEGMSFRPEERATVSDKGDTYNIGTIGNFGGNIGGKVRGNVIGTATQNVSRELEKVAALVRQLRQYEGEMGLDVSDQAEVSRHVDAVESELSKRKPKTEVIGGLLKTIRTTMEGAAGNLIASGVISAVSNISL
jgi:hypothetical protein